jgi:hypothetical protein
MVGDDAFERTASEARLFHVSLPSYTAFVQRPIADDGTSVFKRSRGVVPVKFSLAANGVRTCELRPATIALFQTAGTTVGPVTVTEYTLPADAGACFRIDAVACQYVYNISTTALAAGTYSVKILIDNIGIGAATFGIR